mgnify:FL=1
MKNNIVLLSVLALLFVAKFFVQPIIEWQNTSLAETSRLQKKLDKAQAYIVELPLLESKKHALTEQVNNMKSRVESYSDFDRYQIAKQRQVEALFTQYSVATKSLNWQDTVTTPLGKTAKLQVQFNGLLKDFIALKLDLMSLSAGIELNVFGLQIREGATGSLGDVTGNILLVFKTLEDENVAVL